MTITIKVENADFQSYLPDSIRFVENGLVAAFRPSNAPDGLTDLSGNGGTLTPIGTPTRTATGVYGTTKAGYQTNLKETLSLTYIAVYKIVANGTDKRALAIGSYNASLKQGTTITTQSSTPDLKVLTHLRGSADINVQSTIEYGISADVWRFAVVTVDADEGTVKIYAPAVSPTNIGTFTTTQSAVADRILNTTDPVSLFYYPASSPWSGQGNIAEALIYDRALTESEIMRQYQFSKAAMLERGITI